MSALTWQQITDKMDTFGIPKLLAPAKGQTTPTDVFFSATEWCWMGRARIGDNLMIVQQDQDTARWSTVREATYDDNREIDKARAKQQTCHALEATR